MAPADEMHGIVFKWAANSWVKGIRAEMTGSHPIVTEEAKNLQIVDNHLDGSWNKGKGGNGYFRGSRVWDSLYAGNTSRNLRHFTFQWSAAGNVVLGNDFDSDLNLHGGWERNNLFENNTVRVSYAHRSGNCRANCGEEGGGGPDDSNWFPIWWGAGKKAVKWSGASGPRNVFFNNEMTKQLSTGGAFEPFYDDRQRVYQFGWNGSAYQHLDVERHRDRGLGEERAARLHRRSRRRRDQDRHGEVVVPQEHSRLRHTGGAHRPGGARGDDSGVHRGPAQDRTGERQAG